VTFHDALTTDWIGPGETTMIEVEGVPVGVANVEGEFFAFSATCPHQSTRLAGLPLMRKCLLQCPEHGSVFDVRTGQCVLPSQDGWSGELPTFATKVEGEVVQIALG
jgi:3-phenylpropionate/trans-cinnamate dioxygenase ferredoxin component